MFTLAESYLHTLNPVVVQITAGVAVRWYGLSYVAGFIVAWIIIDRLSRRGSCLVPVSRVGDVITAMVIGVIVGGRLGYVLLYHPHALFEFTADAPWWEVLAINRGGMASHGGMIGVMLAAWWCARRLALPTLHLFDVIALVSPFGLFFGRIANFINGELLGFPVSNQAAPPRWSVKFPQEMHDWSREQLETLAPVVGSIGVSGRDYLDAVATLPLDPKQPSEAADFVGRTIDQLIIATQHADTAVIDGLRPLLTARYPSQIIQAITDGPVLFAILVIVWWNPRRPGIVGGWFLIGYGIMRIFTEAWRMPDVGVDLMLGLSRGRLLSVIMIMAGAAMLVVAARSGREPVGGLGGKRFAAKR